MRDSSTTRLLGATRLARIVRVDDSQEYQNVQVESHAGEAITVPHLQPYGLTACPPKEARTLVQLVGAAWDNVVALATGHGPHRPKNLSAGDVTLYDGHGHRINLTDSGAAINCTLDVDGNTTVNGTVDAADGFKTDGTAGLSGELKITIAGAGVTAGVATLTFKGGILTTCVATGNCVWTSPLVP